MSRISTKILVFYFFALHYNVMSHYFSANLSHFISEYSFSYFILDILHSEVLLEPYFSLMCDNADSTKPKNPYRRRGKTLYKQRAIDQDIKNELCNFIFLDQPEVTMQNMVPLVDHIILYQFPCPTSAEYHMRFARILSIDPDTNTIHMDIGTVTLTDMRRRSSAYRFWLPFRLYTDKIVEMVV